jgi:hypothetical protein
MKHSSLGLIAITSLALSACTGAVNTSESGSSSSAANVDSSIESSIRETHNVSYQGIVQKAGMSIYMEGSHRLELADGRFVLLESSDDLDLDRYVTKKVAVLGAVRPAVEGDGTIMRVQQITLLQQDDEKSSSSEESEESSSSSEASSSSESSDAVAVSSRTASSVKPVAQVVPSSSSKPTSSSSSSSSSSEESSSSVAPATEPVEADIAAKTAIMAKANLADANWTQKYCSTHIGFCFPVHKNWWFKSFGTTSSSLWHVEIGTEEMTELGEGPMVVNLISGSLASSGQTDGGIIAQGEFVVGYKAFNEKSHFEISAPKALENAVRYITPRIQAQ